MQILLLPVCRFNDSIVKVWNRQPCLNHGLKFLIFIYVSSSIVLVEVRIDLGLEILVLFTSLGPLTGNTEQLRCTDYQVTETNFCQ